MTCDSRYYPPYPLGDSNMKFARPLPFLFLLAGAVGSSLFTGCFTQTDVAGKPAVAVQLTAIGEEAKAKKPAKDAKGRRIQEEASRGKSVRQAEGGASKRKRPTAKEDEAEKPADKEDKKGEGDEKPPIRKANPFRNRTDFPNSPRGWTGSTPKSR